jgi:hypothetical protein
LLPNNHVVLPQIPAVIPLSNSLPAAPVPIIGVESDIHALSQTDIIHLMCFYNNDFLILQADNLAVRKTKLRHFMID